MNCNTCRYELSQCLDGRLPSGRRSVVMQHAASCEPCSRFWEELQAAQHLALRLPRQRVDDSFRETLWDRIRSGEGTPEAVFHEPVPTLTKVRYALTGAAAAAVVLAMGLWWNDSRDTDRVRSPAPESVTSVERSIPPVQPVVENHSRGLSTSVATASSTTPDLIHAMRRLDTEVLANETARQIELHYDSVKHSLQKLELRRDRILLDRIVSEAGDLRDFADLLLDLRRSDRLSFSDPTTYADLQLVTRMVGQAEKRPQYDFDLVEAFIAPAVKEARHLRDMRRRILVRPTSNSGEDYSVLIHVTTMQPEVFSKLFLNLGPDEQLLDRFGAQRRSTFWLDGFCGSILVAPRSEIELRNRIEDRVR